MKLCKQLLISLIAITWMMPPSYAEEISTNAPPPFNGLPKWEVGVLGMVSRVPLYRGSDEYRWYSFPIPYFVYRGDFIQADKDGVRGLFYKGVRFEVELSMSGNPPVNDRGGVRAGMPELDPLVEMGPAARLFLYKGEKVKAMYLEAAARGVFSVDMDDLSPGYEGLRGHVSMVLAGIKPNPKSPWGAGLKTGLELSDSRYNGYFYNVDEAYVTPDRPYYQSEGGYGGVAVSGWISRRLFDGVSVAMYARLDNVGGAVFEDSPLVRASNSYMVGAGFTWKIAQSKKQVQFKSGK
jgi:outer membrane scaffolding protein for murein synthesis (MipA/OmpV family)